MMMAAYFDNDLGFGNQLHRVLSLYPQNDTRAIRGYAGSTRLGSCVASADTSTVDARCFDPDRKEARVLHTIPFLSATSVCEFLS